MSQVEGTFLNVDLDLHGSATDIERVVSVMAPSVVVMRHEGQVASLELAAQFSSAESTLQAIAELIQALPCDARSAWDRLKYRSADIGLRSGSQGGQLTGAISLEVLGMMVSSGLELSYTVYPPNADCETMKNIQVIDRAENATFSVFQATEDEFSTIFPDKGQDIELIEDFIKRCGGDDRAGLILTPIWQRPILKRDALGIHGTLYYDYEDRRHHLPPTKREVDWHEGAINPAQRSLYNSKT